MFSKMKNPNWVRIRPLINCGATHAKMLGQLDVRPYGWGILFAQLIVYKLEGKMQREWEYVVDNPESGYDESLV